MEDPVQIIVQPGAHVTVNPEAPAVSRTITREQDAGPLAAAAIGIATANAARVAARFKETLIIEREATRKERIAAEQREAQAKVHRAKQATAPAPAPVPAVTPRAPRQPIPVMRAGEILAGDVAEGEGVLIAWDGAGEIPNGLLGDAVAELGFAPLAPRSAHAHLGSALDSLRRRGYVVRAARGGTGDTARARWFVGKGRPDGQPGDPFGALLLTVTLRQGDAPVEYSHGKTGSPEWDAEGAALAADVEAEYRRTARDELHPPGDVTTWLARTLMGMGAVKMGGAWYVPAASAALAEDLCCRVANAGGGWGANWMLPAIPVTTTEQLKRGIARGALAEVRVVAADLSQRRLDAKRAGRADVGPRSVKGFLADLDALDERMRGFAVLVGEPNLVEARKLITETRADLAAVLKAATLNGELS